VCLVEDGFVLCESAPPLPLHSFVQQVREILGESGPPPDDLATLIERWGAAPRDGRASGPDAGLQAAVITSISPNTGPAHMDKLRSSG